MSQGLKIAHLYPIEMNIYGDTGNVLVLKKRLEWRGLGAEVVQVEVGDDLPNDIDIIVAGGGQDKGQSRVEEDLHRRKDQLHAMADDGVSMLAVCGTYQLLGHRFVTNTKESINGIGLLDVETYAGEERLIGNITIDTDSGRLVGYENHSGLTYLGSDARAFGRVVSGQGNNTEDNSEGAVKNNVFGTYLHGPVLPKNPAFADDILIRALERKYGVVNLRSLDDALELEAQRVALTRKR